MPAQKKEHQTSAAGKNNLTSNKPQSSINNHRAMPRPEPRMRGIAPKRIPKRMPIGNPMKAQRTDQQMQINRIDIITKIP
ncbi:hypothetical protein BCAR13_500033 [Paraburkholderia caribensis]|nr:hypothetical protein BCAR13_500033 [Paraburkholderia caribensis]